MYATCLFCNGPLGANEAIEEFPVGRRLAFDAAKGRLWVVCRRCERWNLTPLEERWEAIESCERAFRATKLRVSTSEIGMARLREGLELVRIGAPLRPEMAAWRYGDQFGRRRRRAVVLGASAAVMIGGVSVASSLLGFAGATSLLGLHVFNLSRAVYGQRSVAARIPTDAGTLVVPRALLERVVLRWHGGVDRWSLDVAHRPPQRARSRWRFDNEREIINLSGDAAIAAARQLLPGVNAAGAQRSTVSDAVDFLEDVPSAEPDALFAYAAAHHTAQLGRTSVCAAQLKSLPAPVRLALEMSAHEDIERRALEGELHLLERAWRDAEEIAAIADDMFLPPSVDEHLTRLKNHRA